MVINKRYISVVKKKIINPNMTSTGKNFFSLILVLYLLFWSFRPRLKSAESKPVYGKSYPVTYNV